MPEIPVESATLFQNSITELEQAESALELAWNELEKQTAETIARIAKAAPQTHRKSATAWRGRSNSASNFKVK